MKNEWGNYAGGGQMRSNSVPKMNTGAALVRPTSKLPVCLPQIRYNQENSFGSRINITIFSYNDFVFHDQNFGVFYGFPRVCRLTVHYHHAFAFPQNPLLM